MFPFLVYFGSIMNTAYNNNALLLLAVFLVAALAFLVCLRDGLIPEKFYPFVIATISFCLIFQVLWISPYLVGYVDTHDEYFLFQLVKSTGRWNPSLPDFYDSTLSVTILPAMVQSLLAVGDTALFKTMYPLTFTFVPVVLFLAYRNIVDSKRAFLSSILFMSYTAYFSEVSFIGKQETAELIVAALLLLTYGGRNIKRSGRSIMMMILLVGLVFAHYSSLYLYLGIVFLSFPLLAALKKKSVISSTFMAIFLVFALCWYVLTARGTAVTEVVQIGQLMFSSFFSDFFQPATRGGVVLMFFGIGITQALVNWINLMVQYSIQLFIILGVLTLWKRRKSVNGQFLSYASISLFLVVSGIVVPYFSSSLNESRIYQFALIFLAPACVLGGEAVFRSLSYATATLRQRSWHVSLPNSNRSLTFASCVIILFLLFNTGFINEISGAPPNSFALGMNRIRGSSNPRLVAYSYAVYLPEQDYASARWLSNYMVLNQHVCADSISTFGVLLAYAAIAPQAPYTPELRPPSTGYSCEYTYYYAYLSYANTVKGIVDDSYPYALYPISEFSNLDYGRNRIYSNNGTVILASEQ
jgi:uncharacterized membrane protein